MLRVLSHYCGVDRRRIDLEGEAFTVDGVPGVRWRALPVASKPAPYSPNRESAAPGDNVALVIDGRRERPLRAVRAGPGRHRRRACGQAMKAAACVLVDGTCWTDDEMITLGVSKKRARDMGHLPQSGAGRHARVARAPARRARARC